jgi:alpha-glucosidase
MARSEGPPWWRRGPIYQIYPRSFCDSDGDGVGDLPGIATRLDHLRGAPNSLGVEAVWLSPFYRSPMADGGYDICDHTAVDPLFGSLEDFDELVAQARARGIRVVVDWVGNHTSDRHGWFEESRASRGSPRRDWYVWRDGRGPGRPPNNWTTAWKEPGPAWTWDDRTAQWYLHSFLAAQPDLNWDNPDVERAMFDVLRFWLDRGVSGFRLDAVYKLGKDPALGDDEPDRRHSEHWPTVHERLRRLRSLLETYDGAIAVGEVYAETQRVLVEYVNSGDELHMVHNFNLLLQPWKADRFRAVIDDFAAVAEPGVWPAWCLNNHDHPRLASRYDADGRGHLRARVAAMLLLTLRGTAFLYQGEELGLRDAEVPPELATDVDGRDPPRAPLPWEAPSVAGPGAGFTAGRPWLPLPPDAERANVAAQARDPGSTLSLYRRLIALRGSSVALTAGSQTTIDGGPGILAYLREAADERLLVALNFTPHRAALSEDAGRLAAGGRVAMRTGTASAPADEPRGDLALDADEGIVVALG